MNNFFSILKENYKLKSFLLVFITAILYGSLINNLNLWIDEIYSVLMAKDSFSDMWSLLTTEDSKPPLYYLYLKLFLSITPQQYEIWVAHFASFVILIVSQIFVAIAVKRDYGDNTALWMMFLIAVMPQSLWLAFEVRTYMLSSFLLLVCLIYGLRLTRSPKTIDFVKFGICSVLALYTHYYCAIFLMFLCLGILITIIKQKSFHKDIKYFLLTCLTIGILFAPWLFVPLSTASSISKNWYVHMDFVKNSIDFFINPLSPDIFQSSYIKATKLISCIYLFVVILGIFNVKKENLSSNRLFLFCLSTFLLSYILFIVLSISIRPMVTCRYLKIFSLVWYMAGACVLVNNKHIQKAFVLIAMIGFLFTYLDIKEISFNKGYQNSIEAIRKNVPQSSKLLAFDNSNLFCEYYLPDYKCILQVGDKGEILRKKSLMNDIDLYKQDIDHTVFSISIFYKPNAECIKFNSDYRYGQNVHICKFDKTSAQEVIDKSLKVLENN